MWAADEDMAADSSCSVKGAIMKIKSRREDKTKQGELQRSRAGTLITVCLKSILSPFTGVNPFPLWFKPTEMDFYYSPLNPKRYCGGDHCRERDVRLSCPACAGLWGGKGAWGTQGRLPGGGALLGSR